MKKAVDLLERVFERQRRDFNVQLWDGRLIEWSRHPKFTLIVNDKKTFKRLFLRGNALTAGEAFIDKKIDITGDLFEAIRLGDYLAELRPSFREKMAILAKLLSL